MSTETNPSSDHSPLEKVTNYILLHKQTNSMSSVKSDSDTSVQTEDQDRTPQLFFTDPEDGKSYFFHKDFFPIVGEDKDDSIVIISNGLAFSVDRRKCSANSKTLRRKIAMHQKGALYLDHPSDPLAVVLSAITDVPFHLSSPFCAPIRGEEEKVNPSETLKEKATREKRERMEKMVKQGHLVVDVLEQALALAVQYQLGPKVLGVFDCLDPLYEMPPCAYFDFFKMASKHNAIDFAYKILMQGWRIEPFDDEGQWPGPILNSIFQGKGVNFWTQSTVEELPVKWVWALTAACSQAHMPKDVRIDQKKVYWDQVAARFYNDLTWRA